MLLNFSVENHLSFRDLVTFDLEATKDRSREAFAVHELEKERVLSVAAVYGANASGKSNLIHAMNWMRESVLAPVSQSLKDPKIQVKPFLLRKGYEKRPSFFEITFLEKGFRYRYGFEANRSGVVSEYLFRKKPGVKEANLFTREKQNILPSRTQFKDGKGLEKRTKPTSLFLTVCASFNVAEAEVVLGWFRQFRFASGLSEIGFFDFTASELQNKRMQAQLLKFAKKADFNICDLTSKVEKISEEDLPEDLPAEVRRKILANDSLVKSEIHTSHTVYDGRGKASGQITWDLKERDSEGTQKFIALAGPILHTLYEGSILMIDEFEARLHPALTSAILDWFQGPANKRNAQLIITTHDVNLMDPEHLRRDQIWFVDKSRTGHSDLSRLSEFDANQVKPTTRFKQHYMRGLYGAFPKVAIDEFHPVAMTARNPK